MFTQVVFGGGVVGEGLLEVGGHFRFELFLHRRDIQNAAGFRSTFGRQCRLSVLDFKYGFNIIANHYLVILQQLDEANEI